MMILPLKMEILPLKMTGYCVLMEKCATIGGWNGHKCTLPPPACLQISISTPLLFFFPPNVSIEIAERMENCP